jgi:hypothetical protein
MSSSSRFRGWRVRVRFARLFEQIHAQYSRSQIDFLQR